MNIDENEAPLEEEEEEQEEIPVDEGQEEEEVIEKPEFILEKKDVDKYEMLVKRAFHSLPETVKNSERFTMPSIKIIYEGKTSVLQNLGDISKTLNRDKEHIFTYMLKEVGTAGNVEKTRGIFKGKVQRNNLEEKLQKYTETFVLCSECLRPDTRMVKDGRTHVLQCDACGAHRPIKTKKTTLTYKKELGIGETIEVLISDIGAKGDGVARMGRNVIFVTGVTKGAKVQIKITNIKGNLIFARKVKDL